MINVDNIILGIVIRRFDADESFVGVGSKSVLDFSGVVSGHEVKIVKHINLRNNGNS